MDATQANKTFSKAINYLQFGEYTQAKKYLLKLGKFLPNSVSVCYNLGLCYQYLNQLETAIDTYKKVLKLAPQSVDARVNLGICYLELKRTEEAQKVGKEAIKLNPQHDRALNFLGSISAKQGNYDQAKELFEKSLATEPNNKDAKVNLANLELTYLNQDIAEALINDLLTVYPEDKKVKLLKGKLLLAKKDTNAAASIVFELKKQFPEDEEVLRLNLSFSEAARDDFGVIDIAKKLLKTNPDDADLWYSLGNAHFELNAIDQSKKNYATAIELDATRPEYKNKLGLVYSSLGDKQNAQQCYREALAINPKYAQAHRNITTMKKFQTIDDPDAQRLIALSNEQDLDDTQIAETAFALGKVYDDCGLYDQAFSSYEKGNHLKFEETRINLDNYFKHIEKIGSFFSSPPVKSNQTSPSISPIFIFGMPRSGTTLVEQIISRHSKVTGCGELPCIEKIIARLEKKSQPPIVYPDDFLKINDDTFAHEANYYVEWVHKTRLIKTPFITDKMPFNFVHIWLIKALFPKSILIHCQRHPLDIITSNYFQLYGVDISFVYNLETLTKYYILQHKLMHHWKTLFDGEIITVVYEALVSDQENKTKQIIRKINLPWEFNCLNFKQSDGVVKTASIWQVRQGIYTSSKERWRNYQHHLQQTIQLLAQEGITDTEGNWIDQ